MTALNSPDLPPQSSHPYAKNMYRWRIRNNWRVASLFLDIGGFLLKYGVIGPDGVRLFWKWADAFEHRAEHLICRKQLGNGG